MDSTSHLTFMFKFSSYSNTFAASIFVSPLTRSFSFSLFSCHFELASNLSPQEQIHIHIAMVFLFDSPLEVIQMSSLHSWTLPLSRYLLQGGWCMPSSFALHFSLKYWIKNSVFSWRIFCLRVAVAVQSISNKASLGPRLISGTERTVKHLCKPSLFRQRGCWQLLQSLNFAQDINRGAL